MACSSGRNGLGPGLDDDACLATWRRALRTPAVPGRRLFGAKRSCFFGPRRALKTGTWYVDDVEVEVRVLGRVGVPGSDGLPDSSSLVRVPVGVR